MPLSKEVQHEIAFLKMAAIELRRIAAEAPDLSNRLLVMAEQIEAEALIIERRGFEAMSSERPVGSAPALRSGSAARGAAS